MNKIRKRVDTGSDHSFEGNSRSGSFVQGCTHRAELNVSNAGLKYTSDTTLSTHSTLSGSSERQGSLLAELLYTRAPCVEVEPRDKKRRRQQEGLTKCAPSCNRENFASIGPSPVIDYCLEDVAGNAPPQLTFSPTSRLRVPQLGSVVDISKFRNAPSDIFSSTRKPALTNVQRALSEFDTADTEQCFGCEDTDSEEDEADLYILSQIVDRATLMLKDARDTRNECNCHSPLAYLETKHQKSHHQSTCDSSLKSNENGLHLYN